MYRMIKRELGISPVELIILERIKLAKALLKDQHMYIKNVCYEAGFEDANYFIRAFKMHEGVTPKQYQLMNQLHKIGPRRQDLRPCQKWCFHFYFLIE